MAQYKVPQDIETEDKLVGPLSLKQLIFAIFFFGTAWFAWSLFQIQPLMALPLIPFIIVFGILAFVQRKDQPVEVYLASLLRFFLVPRVKQWDQDGLTETVRIIAPKKEEKIFTDGRSRDQVTGQLKDLARTIDTRGWAVRDTDSNAPVSQFPSSDRLIGVRELPQVRQLAEIHSVDDPYEDSSPVSTNIDDMLVQQQELYRAQVAQDMLDAQERAGQTQVYQDEDDDEDVAGAYQVAPVVDEPASEDVAQQTPAETTDSQQTTASTMTEEVDPAILSLSNNDELPVSEIERQVQKVEEAQEGEISDGEGIISLH